MGFAWPASFGTIDPTAICLEAEFVDFVFDPHAREQMAFRGINEAEVLDVLRNPHQVVDAKRGRKAYQSIVVREGRFFMLRAFVVETTQPPLVVSVYLTSKSRYWE